MFQAYAVIIQIDVSFMQMITKWNEVMKNQCFYRCKLTIKISPRRYRLSWFQNSFFSVGCIIYLVVYKSNNCTSGRVGNNVLIWTIGYFKCDPTVKWSTVTFNPYFKQIIHQIECWESRNKEMALIRIVMNSRVNNFYIYLWIFVGKTFVILGTYTLKALFHLQATIIRIMSETDNEPAWKMASLRVSQCE